MTTSHDDSFREIQLSGKQVVFVFMAGIVIAVGIFLMGLQVGRGVLMARGAPGETTATTESNDPAPPPASASPASSTSPTTAGEKLSYAERLGSGDAPKDTLKADATPAPPETPPNPKAEAAPVETTPAPAPAAPAPAPAPAGAAAKPTPAPAPPAKTAPAPAAVAAKSTEPAGAGFAIQVAALREADEADAIVKRLAGKGYSAYVVAPVKGAPQQVYRVRVGKFKDRREADTVAAKLQKEEQFKPWIVR